MRLFMDESGDRGLNVGKGSSKLLIVTAVLFATPESAQNCNESIASLREEIGVDEFHFRKNDNDRRIAFFEAVAVHEFNYFAIVCDKELLDSRRWRNPTELFHEIAGRVIDSAKDSLRQAKLYFDTQGSKPENNAFASYLKKQAGMVDGVSRISDAKPVRNSAGNNLIQLADMVCGAIAYSFREKPDSGCFRRTIRHREKCVQEWPAKERGRPRL